jgi:hypothetical protein
MSKIQIKKRYILYFILIIVLFLSAINYPLLKFEYHIFNLSSESPSEREIHYNKIVEMGNQAVPFIMYQLDHPFIFEEFYLLNGLAKITGIDSIQNLSTEDQKKYWKNWWNKNNYLY